jgi:hypothetical protein
MAVSSDARIVMAMGATAVKSRLRYAELALPGVISAVTTEPPGPDVPSGLKVTMPACAVGAAQTRVAKSTQTGRHMSYLSLIARVL